MSRLGLRGRVTLATAMVLALGLALLTLGTNVLLSRQLDRDVASVLRERADVQLAAITLRGGALVAREVPNDETLDEQAWVYYANGRSLRRPAALAPVQRAADGLAGARSGREVSVAEDVRLRAEAVYTDGRTRRVGTVVVGASLVPYEHTERLALIATILLDCFVLAAGVLLARRAVGKALRPVAEMTQRAAAWSEQDLDRRFDLGEPRDELTALSATLDRLLARIAASVRHEQRFSTEMAHELRTPLSGVRGEAELALRAAPSAEVRDSLEQILRSTDRMGSVIETLLAVARSDAQIAQGSADAHAAASAAIDALRAAPERHAVSLELAADARGLRVAAEPAVVEQALSPLLDNALRHARTAVKVSLAPERGAVLFSVEDDGPGLPESDPDVLFEPGHSPVGSAGLGLALARRLARSCGGEVVADSSAVGGRFVLRLPAIEALGSGTPGQASWMAAKRRSPG